jgi:hypothetical protein
MTYNDDVVKKVSLKSKKVYYSYSSSFVHSYIHFVGLQSGTGLKHLVFAEIFH